MARAPWPRYRIVAAWIVAIGWAIALAVYLTAAPDVENPEVYDLEHSKGVLRQEELIGGKAAVLGTELRDFFASLWHGQRLAYTLAAITVLVAVAYWWWGSTEPAPRDEGGRSR